MSDKKASSKNTNFASFVLYLCIALASLAICFLGIIGNPSTFEDVFTDRIYVESLQLDVKQYAQDLSQKNTIPYDYVEDAITYGDLCEISRAYVLGSLDYSERYTPNTYLTMLDAYRDNIENEINLMVAHQYVHVDDANRQKEVKKFAQCIEEYTQKKIEFPYLTQAQEVLSIGRMLSYAIIVISAICAGLCLLSIFNKDIKKYKKLRAITVPFLSASIIDMLLVGGIAVVKNLKDLVVYPLYLADALMLWVNKSMLGASYIAGILFLIFLGLVTCVWKLKRDEKG